MPMLIYTLNYKVQIRIEYHIIPNTVKPVLKPSSAYGWSGGFSPGSQVFTPTLMNYWLDISEIFLTVP